jgi:hypothetical protein
MAVRSAARRSVGRHRATVRRRPVLRFVALAAAFGLMLVPTAAARFTDAKSVGANQFVSGLVDISVAPASAVVTATGMEPGDKVTAPLTVTNSGSQTLRYAIVSTTTENTLAAQLDLTVKTGVTSCTNGGFDSTGTVRSGPGDLGSTTGWAVLGSTTTGAQAGDRTLAGGAGETLCLQVSLPTTTSSAYQSLSTTATLAFVAGQTANNP